MLVLALDTTTKGGSCALARDGRVLHEAAGDPTRPHDVRLPGDLKALLDSAGIVLDDVDVYAVATGPGSFTGLRIGIATMQGLAFAAKKPLIGISAFDGLVRVAGRSLDVVEQKSVSEGIRSTGRAPSEGKGLYRPAGGPLIATWIDAWRGEVYAALYEDTDELEPPSVEPPDELLSRLRGRHTLFIGDGVAYYRHVIVEALGSLARFPDPVSPHLAGTIAVMAGSMVEAGHAPPPHAIRPLYVRRPDAELARDARPVS